MSLEMKGSYVLVTMNSYYNNTQIDVIYRNEIMAQKTQINLKILLFARKKCSYMNM